MGRCPSMSLGTQSSPASTYKATRKPNVPCRYSLPTLAFAVPFSKSPKTNMNQHRPLGHTTTSSSATAVISNSTTSLSSTTLAVMPPTLPETGSLPSAKWFAECCFSGTRQRRLCRVFFLTLGKEALCRVFFLTLGKESLCRVFFFILGKELLCRVFFLTLGKEASLPSVFFDTRQRSSLPSVFFYTRQRKFQSIF